MIGITLARKKWIDPNEFSVEGLKAVAGESLALASFRFAEYVRLNKLSGQSLPKLTGETWDSTRSYLMTKKYGANPAYMVRPGVGIRGSLNYLYGMARGFAVAKSGEEYYYKKATPFITEAWKEWGGGRQVRTLSEAVQASYLRELAARSPETETIEVKA